MRLAALADLILTTIQSAPEATWSDIVPGTDVLLKKALDPSTELSGSDGKILVVPVVAEYDLEASNKRGDIKQLCKKPRVAVVLSYPFDTTDSTGLDVSSWAEVTKILNLREEIDEYVLNQIDSIELADTEPPQELLLDKRWFLSMTEFYFERLVCG